MEKFGWVFVMLIMQTSCVPKWVYVDGAFFGPGTGTGTGAAFGAFMANCGREDGDVAAATMAELGLELDAAAGPAAGAW